MSFDELGIKVKAKVEGDNASLDSAIADLQKKADGKKINLTATVTEVNKSLNTVNAKTKSIKDNFNDAFKLDADALKSLKDIRATITKLEKLSPQGQSFLFKNIDKDIKKIDELKDKYESVLKKNQGLDNVGGSLDYGEGNLKGITKFFDSQTNEVIKQVKKYQTDLATTLTNTIHADGSFDKKLDIDVEGAIKNLTTRYSKVAMDLAKENVNLQKTMSEGMSDGKLSSAIQDRISNLQKEKDAVVEDLKALKLYDKALDGLTKIDTSAKDVFNIGSAQADAKNQKKAIEDARKSLNQMVKDYENVNAKIVAQNKELSFVKDKGYDNEVPIIQQKIANLQKEERQLYDLIYAHDLLNETIGKRVNNNKKDTDLAIFDFNEREYSKQQAKLSEQQEKLAKEKAKNNAKEIDKQVKEFSKISGSLNKSYADFFGAKINGQDNKANALKEQIELLEDQEKLLYANIALSDKSTSEQIRSLNDIRKINEELANGRKNVLQADKADKDVANREKEYSKLFDEMAKNEKKSIDAFSKNQFDEYKLNLKQIKDLTMELNLAQSKGDDTTDVSSKLSNLKKEQQAITNTLEEYKKLDEYIDRINREEIRVSSDVLKNKSKLDNNSIEAQIKDFASISDKLNKQYSEHFKASIDGDKSNRAKAILENIKALEQEEQQLYKNLVADEKITKSQLNNIDKIIKETARANEERKKLALADKADKDNSSAKKEYEKTQKEYDKLFAQLEQNEKKTIDNLAKNKFEEYKLNLKEIKDLTLELHSAKSKGDDTTNISESLSNLKKEQLAIEQTLDQYKRLEEYQSKISREKRKNQGAISTGINTIDKKALESQMQDFAKISDKLNKQYTEYFKASLSGDKSNRASAIKENILALEQEEQQLYRNLASDEKLTKSQLKNLEKIRVENQRANEERKKLLQSDFVDKSNSDYRANAEKATNEIMKNSFKEYKENIKELKKVQLELDDAVRKQDVDKSMSLSQTVEKLKDEQQMIEQLMKSYNKLGDYQKEMNKLNGKMDREVSNTVATRDEADTQGKINRLVTEYNAKSQERLRYEKELDDATRNNLTRTKSNAEQMIQSLTREQNQIRLSLAEYEEYADVLDKVDTKRKQALDDVTNKRNDVTDNRNQAQSIKDAQKAQKEADNESLRRQKAYLNEYKAMKKEMAKLEKDIGTSTSSTERTTKSTQLASLKNEIKDIQKELDETHKLMASAFDVKLNDSGLMNLSEVIGKTENKVKSLQQQIEKLNNSGNVKVSDKNGLNQMLSDLQRKIHIDMDYSEIQETIQLVSKLDQKIKEVGSKKAENKAFDGLDLFIQRNMSKLDQLDKQFGHMANGQIEQVRRQLKELGDIKFADQIATEQKKFTNTMRDLEYSMRDVSKKGNGFFQELYSSMSTYTLGDIIGDFVVDQVRNIKTVLIELDSAMTDLSKVAPANFTGSASQIESVRQVAVSTAKDVGMASEDVIKGMTMALQAGAKTMEDASEIARSSAMFANVGDVSQEQASTYINSILSAFGGINQGLRPVQDNIQGISKDYNQLTKVMDLANYAG